tara:strand:- start:692 stop:1216 length:525 start_codon:yes stop_codon:yes gene_type:complete
MKEKINNISIIYGSDSGCTEEIAKRIGQKLDICDSLIKEVSKTKEEDFTKFKTLILGVSTWYIGDLQYDWDNFFEEFKKIDFTGVNVALFGLGDQFGYSYNYVDGVGILAEVVLKNGGNVFGHWPNKGYQFDESRGLIDEDTFYGLALDEDNEPEYTEERINGWVTKIREELEV